jgi:hypothetical protein
MPPMSCCRMAAQRTLPDREGGYLTKYDFATKRRPRQKARCRPGDKRCASYPSSEKVVAMARWTMTLSACRHTAIKNRQNSRMNRAPEDRGSRFAIEARHEHTPEDIRGTCPHEASHRDALLPLTMHCNALQLIPDIAHLCTEHIIFLRKKKRCRDAFVREESRERCGQTSFEICNAALTLAQALSVLTHMLRLNEPLMYCY